MRFKDKSILLNECKKLISKSNRLDLILKKIQKLKRGQVNPKSTLSRSRTGSYFSSRVQQIFNYAHTTKTIINQQVRNKLNEVISKAEAVLRENIVLQSIPPLDVIKFKNVPVRYAYSSFGGKEQRWGYGLHKLPGTEMGYSICLALMPPGHIQPYHNHLITEYTLALDKKVMGIARLGKNEKKTIARSNQIIYFSGTTPHTLRNPAKAMSRNITVKRSIGLMDWRPVYNLHPIKSLHSKILKGQSSRLGTKGGTKISFSIKDKHYDYKLELLQLRKGSVIENVYNQDKYSFVVEGKLWISSGNIKKYCSTNDYIVIDRNTKFKILTKAKSRLYTLINR